MNKTYKDQRTAQFYKAYREIEALKDFHFNKSMRATSTEMSAHHFAAMAYDKALGAMRAAFGISL
jgi:hypothetical protein